MGKWINTDAAYAVLTDYYHHSTDTQHQALKEALGRVETVDAVPVVRCKDCKYARMTYDGECKYCDIWFPDEAEYMDGDYYCADGERKDGEQHG